MRWAGCKSTTTETTWIPMHCRCLLVEGHPNVKGSRATLSQGTKQCKQRSMHCRDLETACTAVAVAKQWFYFKVKLNFFGIIFSYNIDISLKKLFSKKPSQYVGYNTRTAAKACARGIYVQVPPLQTQMPTSSLVYRLLWVNAVL